MKDIQKEESLPIYSIFTSSVLKVCGFFSNKVLTIELHWANKNNGDGIHCLGFFSDFIR